MEFFNGPGSVQCFFVISGFYMALIGSQHYALSTWSGVKSFYTSRLLRLFPIYWLVCGLYIAFGGYATHFPSVSFAGESFFVQMVVFLANALLLGLDLICFFPTFNGAATLHSYTMINPAWTLALELNFYLIAPFLLRLSTKKIGLLAAISLGARIWVGKWSLSQDPWSHRFFGFELGLFLQ